MKYDTIYPALISFVLAFAVSAVLGPVLIPWLRRLKFGQQILEEGPKWHEKKNGTPTMGGIIFIAGVTAAVLAVMISGFNVHLLMMLLVTLGFGAIGFIDDYVKVVRKQNQGLTAPQKFILQTVLSCIYILVMNYTGDLNTEIIIPFAGITCEMPWWLYIVFTVIVVTGTVNAVNLTDGLDGLAASITLVVMLFFAVGAVFADSSAVSVFAASAAGGCLAFLIFNHYPARVFMGDTGSLFLGGAVCVSAIALKMPLVLIIAGFVYLFEALSVILQVASFKLTGKRIFKMSPIHHHFEMCGWSEVKIVSVFTAVTLVLCIAAFVSVM